MIESALSFKTDIADSVNRLGQVGLTILLQLPHGLFWMKGLKVCSCKLDGAVTGIVLLLGGVNKTLL